MPLNKKLKLFLPSIITGLLLFIGIILSFFYVWLLPFLGIAILILIVAEFIIYLLNKKGELIIKTPDGSDQPYHPSVLFFQKPWNDYKYWMAYTPFPIGAEPYRDRWEYPCIAVSNDGINWISATNNLPLDDLSSEQITDKDYFSDTHLVYNEQKNRIECYYRLSEEQQSNANEKGVWLFRRYSYDGVTWSDRETSIKPWADIPQKNTMPCISPAIIIEDNNYKMWYVAMQDNEYCIFYSESKDGLSWGQGKKCELVGCELSPWHIDCKKIEDTHYLLVYDFSQRLTLYNSNDRIKFSYVKTILNASNRIGSFYKSTLYRACMLIDGKHKVYFSAGNDRRVCIGLMEGNNLEDLRVVSASNVFSIKDFLIDYILKYSYIERWFIWKLRRVLHIGKQVSFD